MATAPDGTRHQETYETAGWKKGITKQADEFSADDHTNPKKWTVVNWTQDDPNATYQLNPRITQTDIYDSVGNHKRTDVTYTSSFGLPSDVKEYNADGLTVLRRTHTEYLEASVTGGAYLTRRIIGLPKERYIYGTEGGTEALASKLTYEYDLTTGEFLADAGTVAQHGAAFDAGFTTRGNLCRVKRWDVQHPLNSLATETGYNTLGSVVFTRDALGHQKTISYIDSDSGARLAYPTTVTDPGNFSSALEYNYDMGAPTRTMDPKGAATKIYYDAAGRKLKVKSEFNSAYTRWEYDASGLFSKQLTTVDTGLAETFVMGVSDGAGRTRGTLRELPGSSGGYSAQRFSYNNVGQQVKQYNPTEVTIDATSPSNIASWLPAGGDSPSNGGAGWVYSSQKYEWKGRPTVTTNQDDTQKTITYGGCGCAGGEVTTMQGELVPIPGTSTQGRRTQKIYADVLGRQIKTEVLDWDGTTVYSTTTTKYNALDQVKRVRQYIGAAPSPEPDGEGSTYQTTTMTYDGYGRPKSKHVPGQNDGTQTVYEYFDDDTVKSTTDARGVKTTFAYNTRQLVTGVTYDKQGHTSVATDKGGTTDVPDTPAVTVSYDAAGNRETMTDGSGTTTYHFDTISRLSSEGRQLTGLSGTYTLSYEYTLSGALKKVNDVTAGTNFAYDFDRSGQMTTITSAGLGATAPLASSMQYRAWGALKGVSHGNGTSLALSYSSRGQITHYGVGGVTSDGQYGAVAHGSDFTYYGDGKVKFAADLFTDALVFGNYKLHDRAYSYDHAARLKEAYSGWEANQFATGTASGVDGAFRQSYAYDAFDNNTGRTGSIWTAADNDGQAFDSRGRVTAWEYDPDGRLVSRNEAAPNTQPYEALRDSYDAAGRLAQTTQKTSSSSLVNPNLILTTTRTKTETYDGAGQVVKETTTGQVNNGTPSTSATFYLRSSALGGRVISEYNGSGVRQVTHIMAGAEAVADSWNNSSGPAVIWRHTNPVTGDEIDTDAQGAVSSKVTLDPTGTNLGDTDPSTGTGGFDEGGGPSQGQMNKMYAQLLPPSAGGNAPQARVDGFQVNASVANFLLSVGAAKRSPNSTSVLTIYSKSRGENVGLAVYNPQAAEKGVAILGAGSLGYLPVGTNYTQGVGLQFQDWFGSYYSGLHQNFLSEKAAQVYSMPFLGRESPQDTSQQKNCATPNSLVKYFKTQFEAQWDKTAKSAKPGVEGEENGSLIFYEGATNKYPIVELSEGSHVRLGSTSYAPSVPGLPEVGPETSKALADFSSSRRSVYFLAFFHTHPDFAGFPPESRSGDPSDWDKQYQRDYGNVLGIIRTSKGYSFFSNGKAFRSGDAKADECIWELNRASN
jgi:YD repeat-containing protein